MSTSATTSSKKGYLYELQKKNMKLEDIIAEHNRKMEDAAAKFAERDCVSDRVMLNDIHRWHAEGYTCAEIGNILRTNIVSIAEALNTPLTAEEKADIERYVDHFKPVKGYERKW